jgi:UDP-glucose 4-epimerase
MHIFVTGGAGYIGSICSEKMIDSGHQVTIFDNLTEGHRAAIDPRAKFIEGDLANREQIAEAMNSAKPDAVMHFAANALVGESMTNPSKYFRNNVSAGINLLDAAVGAGVKKFVFSSTCATYGTPEKVPIDERLPQKPINPYGQSKLMFEQILHWYDKIHGLVHVNLRYFNAAGASARYGEDHRIETHLIPNILKVALGQKERAEIFGEHYATPDGTCIRDYIHIHDLAAAHMLALGRETSSNYNLGSGEGFSVRQVIDIARKVTGAQIPAVVMDARPGDPPRLVASSHKITSELGWRPQYARLQPILESAWAWHQKHPDGYGD